MKKRLEKRFKDPVDPLQLVIVCDMWLTGFDAPCVHTLYVDKTKKEYTHSKGGVDRPWIDAVGLDKPNMGLLDKDFPPATRIAASRRRR